MLQRRESLALLGIEPRPCSPWPIAIPTGIVLFMFLMIIAGEARDDGVELEHFHPHTA
jgi:hypothetical protein